MTDAPKDTARPLAQDSNSESSGDASGRPGPSPVLPLSPRRRLLHDIIFESDTPAGRRFDLLLILLILALSLIHI